MTMGIQPESIDKISNWEMVLYSALIPLYFEFMNTNMENSIKKAISELFRNNG